MTVPVITLAYQETRSRLLDFAEADPTCKSICTYDVCIVGKLLKEKMTAEQYSELCGDFSSRSINTLIDWTPADRVAPKTFDIRVDCDDTRRLLSNAQHRQDIGSTWGDVGTYIRRNFDVFPRRDVTV